MLRELGSRVPGWFLHNVVRFGLAWILFGTAYMSCWLAVADRTPVGLLYAPLFLVYLPFFLLVYSPFLAPSLIAYLVLAWRVTRRRVAVALGPLSGAGALLAPGLDTDTRIYDSPALVIGILLGGAVYGRFVRLNPT